jgi:hypothetical protein
MTEPIEKKQLISSKDQELAVEASQILIEREAYRRVVGAMVAFRQGYAMAYNDLERLLAAEKDVPSLTLEVLIQSASYQASREFDEKVLLQGFEETVFPWMVETLQRHESEDGHSRRVDRDSREEARRAVPVPIGISQDLGVAPQLERHESLVLVGWKPAVLWLLDEATTCALAANVKAGVERYLFSVTRLSCLRSRGRSMNRVDDNYRILYGEAWDNSCKSNAEFARRLAKYKADGLVDLLVIDDIPHAKKDTIQVGDVSDILKAGRPAGNAHKIIRRWASEVGAAVLAGVCLEEKGDIDLTTPVWEQLKTFSFLRPVTVMEEADNLEENHYRILVGRNACYFDVPKEVIDDYDMGDDTVVAEETSDDS